MTEKIQFGYAPDYAVIPGVTLQETLEALSMPQAELASRTGLTPKTINEIVAGKAPITAETALHLEKVLGVPASFWISLESKYQEAKARISDREMLKENVEWLKQIPVREMARAGWVKQFDDKVEQLRAVLSYFGVTSPEAWKERWLSPDVAFRKSPTFESNPGAVAAWLRCAELSAQKIPCKPYNRDSFMKALKDIRAMTILQADEFQIQMRDACANGGVALVFVPEIKGTVTSGATRWLSPDKAMIALSLRHKQNDFFWFTFFHEAAHVLLHGKKKVFIEMQRAGISNDPDEVAANKFAGEFLIPPGPFNVFVRGNVRTKEAVRDFAKLIGIAPGIVAGRLQHDQLIPRSYMNDLKVSFEWEASSSKQ